MALNNTGVGFIKPHDKNILRQQRHTGPTSPCSSVNAHLSGKWASRAPVPPVRCYRTIPRIPIKRQLKTLMINRNRVIGTSGNRVIGKIDRPLELINWKSGSQASSVGVGMLCYNFPFASRGSGGFIFEFCPWCCCSAFRRLSRPSLCPPHAASGHDYCWSGLA